MKNAELIGCVQHDCAKCKAQADAIEALESQLKNASVSAIAEAAEVDRMKAEVERLTTFAYGQHIELYNARLQLAAAQGQSQQYDEALCTVAEQRDTMKLRIRQHLANRYAYTFKEFCEKLEEILYAPNVTAAAPQPKETK